MLARFVYPVAECFYHHHTAGSRYSLRLHQNRLGTRPKNRRSSLTPSPTGSQSPYSPASSRRILAPIRFFPVTSLSLVNHSEYGLLPCSSSYNRTFFGTTALAKVNAFFFYLYAYYSMHIDFMQAFFMKHGSNPTNGLNGT